MEIIISQGTNDKSRASSRSASSNSRRPANAQRSSAPRQASGQRPSGQRPSGQRPNSQRTNAQRAPQGNRRKKKKGGISAVLIILIVALVLAIAVAGSIGVYAMRYADYDKILPNVYVAGIDVGGMTVEEATEAIESALSSTEQQSVNVILPDQTLTFTPQQDTILLDVDKAVAKAYSYGRNSTSPFAMARAIEAAQRTRNDIDISTAVEIDTTYIRDLIDTTATEVSSELVESDVQVDTDKRIITVTIGSPGRSLDTETLYNLVSGAFASGDYSDIEFDYTMAYPANVALDRLYEQLTTEPEDAYYDPSSGEVVEEQVGYVPSVALEDANQQLAMAASGEVLTFGFDETPAEMTKAELEPMLFRDTLYAHGTTYAINANRTENLRLACAAINGTVLQPGEVFSFNDTVGERTSEKGYREGVVYVGGDSEPALGGGICQVASTIYYCAMYADLEIVHREAHMFTVDYVPGGLDATVYWGSVDFQFRNSTDYPMKIYAYLSGGKVWVELIGTDVYNYTVEITSTLAKTIPYSTITKDGIGENQSGYTGKVYTITRKIYDSNGNLVREDSTADLDAMGNLGTTTHSKRDAIIYQGEPEPAESEEPSTEPSPSTPPTSPSPSTPPTTPSPSTPPSTDPTPGGGTGGDTGGGTGGGTGGDTGGGTGGGTGETTPTA